jgi:hypothetical protein
MYKVGAVRVTKISGSGGTPAPAPTTTASAPTSDGAVSATAGGEEAEVKETMVKEG